MTTFVPGLQQARSFYHQTVRPVLDSWRLPHSAARIGPGSECLGRDTPRSMDHDWWHRLEVFVAAPHEVPELHITEVPNHRVTFHEAGEWLTGLLGCDPRQGFSATDWLATPAQRLLEITAGEVFHDGLGVLTAIREQLAFYPDDVWRYQLAALWNRIGQEQPFVGRCGETGDDIGSRIVAARLARDALRLTLLYRREYPPYAKWLGNAAGPHPHLTVALSADSWPAREEGLLRTYSDLMVVHNSLELAAPVSPVPLRFHDHPFWMVDFPALVNGLVEGIADPALRQMPPIGGVDLIADNTDVLCNPSYARCVGLAARSA